LDLNKAKDKLGHEEYFLEIFIQKNIRTVGHISRGFPNISEKTPKDNKLGHQEQNRRAREKVSRSFQQIYSL